MNRTKGLIQAETGCFAKVMAAEESEECQMLNLPDEEYIKIEKNGKLCIYCTMRQKALHTIGYNCSSPRRRLYTRHGKKYYKPYRNYFTGNDKDLDKLIDAGYMDYSDKVSNGKMVRTYWFNRNGLDWLGEQINVHIYDEE